MVDLGRAFGWSGRPFGDKRPWTTAEVVAVDEAGARLEVMVDGARAVVPRLDAADYQVGDTVIVMRDPEATGSGQVALGTIGAVREPEPPPATGRVTSVSSGVITVSTDAGSFECQGITSAVVVSGDDVLLMWDATGEPWVIGKVGVIPAAPGTPSAPSLSRSGSTVTIDWSPFPAGATQQRARWRRNGGSWSTGAWSSASTRTLSIAQGQTLEVQVQARNSGGVSGWSSTASITYAAPTPPTETVTVTIRPTWSGTYRHNRSAWDRWNVDRYGGRSTLYQGSAHGSGSLTGLAVYGTRVRDLGAISITRIEVTLRGAGLVEGSYPSITVQGSPHGSKPSGAPSSSGDTASGSPGKSGTAKVALPSSVREAFRTGDVRGLALVGSGYGAVRGTSAADGMALRITYTRRK